MSHLGLVAPYAGLAALARQVCAELGEDVTITIGDLAEGVKVARELAARGAEVIISRGGTATLISRHVEVPVVEIAVSAFDLVRALAEARELGRYIGVAGFRNVIYGTKSLESVLGVHIEELIIEAEEGAAGIIAEGKAMGLEVIVGDAVSVRSARELGLQAILVTSGKEAINQAIREAREVALVRRRERARAEQFKAILDFAYEGIVATDQEGRITLVNPAAEKILGLTASRVVGRPAREVLPGVPLDQVRKSGQKRLGELHRAGNTLVAENVVPVITGREIVGAVATFQDVSHLQAVETRARQELYLKGHVAQFTFDDIVTCSPVMARVIERARQFAAADATILITGETGSGKEMVAQSIHNASQRREGPFVAVNCAAVPENLLESELFGYEEGAFTGARKGGKKGLFELAHRGTLFLDEIGELSLNLQARLLRVLQQKAIMRVGGDRVLPVDVRIIAATHRDLEEAVARETFRRDLYYRLNVLHIKLPPLRERLEDLPLLIKALVEKVSRRSGRLPPLFSEDVIARLQAYDWPGNVRELENIIERLVVLRSGQEVEPADLEEILGPVENKPEPGLQLVLRGTLEEMEAEIIRRTLALTNNNKDETCRRLGLSKTTLWRRLKSWQEGGHRRVSGS
ncbi:sigma-54-dependent Fis family transcriptional regulator [Moorella sp. E308F]|uniref:sigma 54-interacting transcriptional regulator n=1 Tax=Moorella sp. E308F TaxID=2572682 RepID=UPI0010FFB8B8|nr:sigma 54-interacting transcriptional regulator [Moorella sp. E308F]GEA14887.1 sigma-54-dependent Fis family transcriptional regulator [Moorella sp. E308F]